MRSRQFNILLFQQCCNVNLGLMCLVSDRRGVNIFQVDAGDAPLREPGKISITFTPRVFPTPTRESLAPEEEAVCGQIVL